MAKFQPMTRAEWRAHRKRQERLTASTQATLCAGLDVLEAGGSEEEMEAAMAEASRRVPLHDPRHEPPMTGVPPEGHLRLADQRWIPERQRIFLGALSETGCVSQACEAAGMSRQSAYALRRRAPNSVFALCWDIALHMANQAILDELTERALMGSKEQIWYHGEHTGTRIVHNDRLAMFLLTYKREPMHPALDARELTHLFPTLLKMVDLVLPPAFSAERIAELTGEDGDGDE